MKKLLFLCGALLCCFSAFAQIGFTVSATTITSEQEVTITSTGENHSIGVGNKYIQSVGPFSVVSANPSTYLSAQSILWTSVSYSTSSSPTVIKVKPKNTSSVPVTVTYKFQVNTYDNWAFQSIAPYDYQFTLTVNPAPVIFYNVAKSGQFTRNNCGAGFSGTIVTYPVNAHTYSSTISQADADQKAINDVNTNGQAYANANGTCNILYSSIAYSGNFTKNNCDSHSDAGPAVPYTLQAGSKTSSVSQADANAQALALFNTNGQNNANATGTCIPKNKTFISFSNQAKPGSTITRLRVYSGSTLVADFNEAQLLAGAEINPGTYKFVVTTVGPLSNTTTNTGWATLELRASDPPYQSQYFDNTGTTYTFNTVVATSQQTIQLFLYFLYA